MASLRNVMVYLVSKYPHKDDLANARLTKMIYLADWRSAVQNGRQITGLTWEFNHYGPYLRDVIEVAQSDDNFNVTATQTMYGTPKQVISVKAGVDLPDFEPWEKDALDHVLQQTGGLTWARFIELVYSTYPIATEDRYSTLDLVALASTYKQLQESLPSTRKKI